jgi:hypothetical protein
LAMGASETFAFGHMRVKFILLFCRPASQSLYEHLGRTKVSSLVWAEQARGRVLLKILSMVKRLGPEQWPGGEIQLGSRPG